MKSLKSEEALPILAGIGYDAVELAVISGWDMDPATVTPARRVALKRQLVDTGLRLTSLMENLPPSPDAAKHAAALERLKAASQLAHDLSPDHPPLIETVLGGTDWAKSKPIFLNWLADWQKLAESHATIIAIKPHRGGAMSRPEEAIELFRELGSSKWLRMVYDYSHYALRDMPLDQTIRTALPWTEMIAVKDVATEKDQPVFKLPGETGQIDYAAMLRQFYTGGYRGVVSCEVSAMISKKPDYDPVQAAKTCYANLAKAFVVSEVPRPKKP
jgi:inosose dehydratase